MQRTDRERESERERIRKKANLVQREKGNSTEACRRQTCEESGRRNEVPALCGNEFTILSY